MRALARYLPSIVLGIWVLLLVSGMSPHVLRVPGLMSLAVAMLFFASAESESARTERRRGTDRRQR